MVGLGLCLTNLITLPMSQRVMVGVKKLAPVVGRAVQGTPRISTMGAERLVGAMPAARVAVSNKAGSDARKYMLMAGLVGVTAVGVNQVAQCNKTKSGINGFENINQKFLKAVESDDLETVRIALQFGADINAVNEQGEPALFILCRSRHPRKLELAKFLLAQPGINVNVVVGGETLLDSAEYELMNMLLTVPSLRLDIPNDNGETFLHRVMKHDPCFGAGVILPGYMKSSLKINVVDNHGNTPFHSLAKSGTLHLSSHVGVASVSAMLACAEVDPNILNKDGHSPLFLIASNANNVHSVIKMLQDPRVKVGAAELAMIRGEFYWHQDVLKLAKAKASRLDRVKSKFTHIYDSCRDQWSRF